MILPTISTLPLGAIRNAVRRLSPQLAVLVLALLVIALPQRAFAHAAGWPSDGCSGCHNGGQTPTVSIASDITTINPGQLVNLTVSISATNGHGAGFFLEANAGKFSIVDSGTKLLGNGVTQNARRTGTGNATTFKVAWTAPATPGGVDFYAYGNSVNGDGSSFGDHDGVGFLSFAYGCTGIKYYHDYDGDGVGASAYGYTMACSLPLYYSARGDDCNDQAPANFPGNKEICDGVDNNCNGLADEALTNSTYCTDADGDGHGAAGKATMTGCAPMKGFGVCDSDCNDADVAIYPGHAEVCDGKDNNCDGFVDELLPIATYCPDADGDGHGVVGGAPVMGCIKPAGYGQCDNDCNDHAPTVYVGATEICDGKDNDCNDKIDENALLLCGVGWCARAASGCSSICTPGEPGIEVCNDFDDDCDGVNDNGTDLALCGKPGLHCAAGYCVPALDGEAGAGGESGASEPANGGVGGMATPPAIGGSGGTVSGGGTTSGGSAGAPLPPGPEPSSSSFACSFALAPASSSLAALGVLLALGLIFRRNRRP